MHYRPRILMAAETRHRAGSRCRASQRSGMKSADPVTKSPPCFWERSTPSDMIFQILNIAQTEKWRRHPR
jgi:hypothetical protein